MLSTTRGGCCVLGGWVTHRATVQKDLVPWAAVPAFQAIRLNRHSSCWLQPLLRTRSPPPPRLSPVWDLAGRGPPPTASRAVGIIRICPSAIIGRGSFETPAGRKFKPPLHAGVKSRGKSDLFLSRFSRGCTEIPVHPLENLT